MGAELSSVDLTTLPVNGMVNIGLDDDSTLRLVVADPASGLVTIYENGLEPLQVTYVNAEGQHVLSVSDDLMVGSEPTSRKVTSVQVQESGALLNFAARGESLEAITELLDLLRGEGIIFTLGPVRDSD